MNTSVCLAGFGTPPLQEQKFPQLLEFWRWRAEHPSRFFGGPSGGEFSSSDSFLLLSIKTHHFAVSHGKNVIDTIMIYQYKSILMNCGCFSVFELGIKCVLADYLDTMEHHLLR